ncbi:MAG: exopolysaccharide biosynthesis protein [Pseudomonadota bacterium]
MSSETHDLENVLEALDETAQEAEGKLTVGQTVDAFAQRSFGALLTMVSLIAALPIIGAIPGVSILTGTIVILIAAQYLIGRETPWLPDRLRKISVDPATLQNGIEKVKPYVARVDAVIKPRWTVLTEGPVARTSIAIASIALAIIFYPMAVIPGGVWLPALAVMALGLALVGRDGVLAAIGGALGLASIYAVYVVVA